MKYPCHVAEGAEAGQGDSLSGVCSAVVVPQAGNEGSVSCCGVRSVCGRQGGDTGNSRVPKAERQLLLSFLKKKMCLFCFVVLTSLLFCVAVLN